DAEPVPMLVLGTYRDTEVGTDHPLGDLVADLRRLATVDVMGVVGLSPTEVEEFVDRAVGQRRAGGSRRLAESLYANTEGNPFFLHEVLRDLTETTTIGTVGDPLAVEPARLKVPEGVSDVVGGRIRRLSDPAKSLLAVAAVLGADFDVELLVALSDLPEGDLLDGLDQSRRARVIEETGPDRYRFAHALVRATLVEALSATRRRRLHRRIAEAMEKLRPDDVGALAHHFAEAGPDSAVRSRAVRFGLAAAERALAARALADAETRFRSVLMLLDESGDIETVNRARATCGLGEAQRDQGEADYRTTLLEAAGLARECGDVSLLVRAALSNSRELPSVIGGLDAERLAVTEAALAALGPSPSAARALLLAQLAAEISFTRDDRRRLALADEAEAMARLVGDEALLARVLNRTGYAAFSAARVDRLVTRGEEATRLSDASGDPAQRVLARYFWSGALLTAGQLPAFRTVTRSMLAVADQAAPTFQWVALASQVRLHQIDGDVAAAQRTNQEAFTKAMEIGEPDGVAWWTATDTMLAWCQGRFGDPVAAALRVGMDVYPAEPAWAIGYAMALAMEGRLDEAREVLYADPPDVENLVNHVFPFLNASMCGVIAFHVHDPTLAARTATALRGHRHSWVHHYVGSMGPVALPLALSEAAVGHIDDAAALCEEAERVVAALGCDGVLPQLRTYHADILLRRGSPEDRLRAGGLLQDARRGAEAIDAHQLVARINDLTSRLSSDMRQA
ncbi:MAG: hypothetical protein M3326_00690, partial [Actinomycetota bacterium]|nr:hypothetical protein [Actinomycetota bacterium]